MGRAPEEYADAAYKLRHRMRQIGSMIESARDSGPIVTIPHAAWMLAVDPSRVRRLIAEDRFRGFNFAGDRWRYVAVEDLLKAPTEIDKGRPYVLREDGRFARDDPTYDGLCLPDDFHPIRSTRPQKNRRSGHGR